MSITRRHFLVGGGAAAAGLALGSCAGSSTSSGPTTVGRLAGSGPSTTAPARTLRRAGQRPDPRRPEGTDLLPQIEHVVVVMMENHSFDNYLGMLRRGDGFDLGPDGRPTATCMDRAGRPVRAFHMANTCQLPKHPNQDWNATHAQWDQGRMDGFVRSDSGAVAMGYWTATDLPYYHALASTFPLCDRWFGSCMGQTYPNRRFLLAGTARGNVKTDITTISDFQPPNGTIMSLLDRHGIAWRNYFSDVPTTALFAPTLTSRDHANLVPVSRYFADAAAGTLPAFSLVDPNFDHASEENSDDISTGESFVARVVNAAMAGPGWAKTVLIWTYDEHGGYYDHVPPPAAVPPDAVGPRLEPGDAPGGYDVYGLRVPAVVVSPYARRDHVSHVVHDHTSILKLVETKFNLPALTDRDANADDLLDCLDLHATPAFATPPALPAPRNPNPAVPLCQAAGPIPNPAG